MKWPRMQRLLFVVTIACIGCDGADPMSTAPTVDAAIVPVLGRVVHAPPNRVVSFGDSFSDVGNLHVATGGTFAPPPYFDGRFTNGRTWVEVAAERLGLPTVTPSITGGSGYAWGGARSGGGTVFGVIPNTGAQIDAFIGDGEVSARDLVILWIGTNDGIAYVSSGGTGGSAPGAAVSNIAQHIGDLASAGGMHFLVPDLFALSATPSYLDDPLAGALDAWVDEFDRLLEDRLKELEAALGVHVLRLEAGELLAEVIRDPSEVGLTNVTDPACGGCRLNTGGTVVPDPDGYLWWDQIHFTRVAHELVGDRAAAAVMRKHHRPYR